MAFPRVRHLTLVSVDASTSGSLCARAPRAPGALLTVDVTPGWPTTSESRRPDGAVAVVRRAPFSDNPRVGTRGQRTQQRILDAALQVFGDEGYHRCSVDKIAKLGGCSRVSFYQYFASKEDVFRQLGEQVARQLERIDRGARPAHRRRRRLARDAGVDRALP